MATRFLTFLFGPPRRALTRVLVLALMVGAVAITVAQRSPGLSPWWLELSRYLPYPVLLLPAALAVVLSLPLGRMWLALSVLVLCLSLTLGMGFVWRGPDAGSVPVRMMTYNAKAFQAAERPNGLERLAIEVAEHNPDLLVMQDAGHIMSAHMSSPPTEGQVYGLPYAFAVNQFIVASRFPLHDCAMGNAASATKDLSYVKCTVDTDRGPVTLLTTHFESPRRGLNAARHEGFDGLGEWRRNYEGRLIQSQALSAVLKDLPRPLIVAGDLNAPESSPVLQTLLGTGLRDAFSAAGRGWGYTYGHALHVGFSFLRIDHILVSPEIGVVMCRAGGGAASEHRPVVADLVLRRDASLTN